MMNKNIGLTICGFAWLMATGVADAAVVDFSRNGGADFDNNSPTVTAPVDVLDPTKTVTVNGSLATGASADLVFIDFGVNGTSYGVQSSPIGGVDSRISGNDRMSFTFNFEGALDGFDVVSLTGDDRVILTKTSGAGTEVTAFVDGAFYTESNKPSGTIRLEPTTDSIVNLTVIDPDFFSFQAGDVFTFSEGFGASFGMENIEVLVPTPATAAMLGLGALAMLRRRG